MAQKCSRTEATLNLLTLQKISLLQQVKQLKVKRDPHPITRDSLKVRKKIFSSNLKKKRSEKGKIYSKTLDSNCCHRKISRSWNRRHRNHKTCEHLIHHCNCQCSSLLSRHFRYLSKHHLWFLFKVYSLVHYQLLQPFL